jgi:starch synthase
MAQLSVLQVCSEVTPFVKTGGVADVCSSLSRALARAGVKVNLVVPRYQSIDPVRHALARRLSQLEVQLGGARERVTLYEGKLPGGLVSVTLIDHPLYDRPAIYGDNGDYPDNARRFALLGRVALEVAHHAGSWPDIVHAHDWQGGFAVAYAKMGAVAGRPIPKAVFTVHNLAFQGLAPREVVPELGLPWELFTPESGEFYGQLSQLKLGMALADRITTVSPTYAREIQTATHGAGLDGFLTSRRDRLVGILNGIDLEVWDPSRDPHIAVRYDAEDRSGKAACKSALQREVGLPVRAGVPLLGKVARMNEQKGWRLLIEAGEELAGLDAQFVFLAHGERRFEEGVANLVRRYPGKFAFKSGEDEPLAHRIEAGADFFLMPSIFEPCGLNQMYSQRYGTVPVVRATGGLEDTIVDYDETTRTGTGFKFVLDKPDALVATVRRALSLYKRREAFDALVGQIMRIDHGWARSAKRYLELYERLR